MPRVISDELYEDLISNIYEGRLLGVMGKLERLQLESIEIEKVDELEVDGKRYYDYWVEKEKDETKTNNN